MTGSGTIADPVRPLFAPTNARDYQRPNGIREFKWQPTDDGKHANVEFVAQASQGLPELVVHDTPNFGVSMPWRGNATTVIKEGAQTTVTSVDITGMVRSSIGPDGR